MSTEIVKAERNGEFLPALSIQEAVERFQVLGQFIGKIMHDGTDFGVIPGTEKPTLYKPGAEKLCTFFGLRKIPELVSQVKDWTGTDHGGEPCFEFSYRYHLYRGDVLIASGDGSCNSWEKKYRWKRQERTCPECGKQTIIKGKAEYGGGWLCWRKPDKGKDGCGAKFPEADQRIISQVVGQIPNPDVFDLVNTIQKMAAKRALIAATLLAVNASEFFTQDVEDMADQSGKGEVIEAEFERSPAPPRDSRAAAMADLGRVVRAAKQAGMTNDDYAEMLSQFQASRTDELNEGQLRELTDMIRRQNQSGRTPAMSEGR